jgi:hypothetical protein
MPIAVKALRGVGSDPATTVFLRDRRGLAGEAGILFVKLCIIGYATGEVN